MAEVHENQGKTESKHPANGQAVTRPAQSLHTWVGVDVPEWRVLETSARCHGTSRCRTANHERDGVETMPVVLVGTRDIDNVHLNAQCHTLKGERSSFGSGSGRTMVM